MRDHRLDSTFQPEECFLRPVRVGQNPELKTAEDGYVWQPYDCRYDLMSSEDRLSCFRDKNVTRFLDFGDRCVCVCVCVCCGSPFNVVFVVVAVAAAVVVSTPALWVS